MKDLTVANKSSNEQTMSSLEIAELCEKQHKHVLTDIRKMLKELGKAEAEFSSTASYEVNGATRQREIFNLPRRECDILISGYNIKYRAAIIDRWQELEKGVHRIPQSYSEALSLAAEQALIIEQRDAQLLKAAPKVEFVDNYVDAKGLHGFRQTAKLLQANEARFREFLLENKIMYYLQGGLTAHGNHITVGRFEVKTGESNGRSFNSCKFTAKGLEWVAGMWGKHKLSLNKE